MLNKIRVRISIIGCILCWNFCITALAGTVNEFSFVAPQICKNPPKSPSDKILYKNYKISGYFGEWKIYDVNGDGWCDWVRGGHEGYRTDNEEPPMRDFIYLGTLKGWRRFDQAKLSKKFKPGMNGETAQNVLSENDNALNFYQPIAIYKKGENKPFIAAVARHDAPAPVPDRNQIEVYQWNDELDKLLLISQQSKGSIIDFLHAQLCKYPPAIRDRDGQYILAMGNLCFPRD